MISTRTQYADFDGRIKNLSVTLSPYARGQFREQLLDGYAKLFTNLEPDTRVTVAYQTGNDRADVERLIDENGLDPDRFQFVRPPAPEGLTVWARDAMVPLEGGVLLTPSPRHPWHGDDQSVPAAICQENPQLHYEEDLRLVTDGGDLQANSSNSFVGYYSLAATARKLAEEIEADPERKAQVDASFTLRTGAPPSSFEVYEELARQLFEEKLGKPVIVLGADDPTSSFPEEPPTSHLDMGCIPVDDRTVFVNSPALAGVSAPDLQANYDACAQTLINSGYQVVRLPSLKANGFGKPNVSYTNVLMERFAREDGTPVQRVFMPVFGLSGLDDQATSAWQDQGYEVVPVAARNIQAHWGPRSVTNVLERR